MPCDKIVSVHSPVKSIGCAAKKLWLRAAMSEDHSEPLVNGGDGGGGGHGADRELQQKLSVWREAPAITTRHTPLKKRTSAFEDLHDCSISYYFSCTSSYLKMS